MTPPMTDESQPNDMAPKQAWKHVCGQHKVFSGCGELGAYRAGEKNDTPAIDLVGIRGHGIVLDDLLEDFGDEPHLGGCEPVVGGVSSAVPVPVVAMLGDRDGVSVEGAQHTIQR